MFVFLHIQRFIITDDDRLRTARRICLRDRGTGPQIASRRLLLRRPVRVFSRGPERRINVKTFAVRRPRRRIGGGGGGTRAFTRSSVLLNPSDVDVDRHVLAYARRRRRGASYRSPPPSNTRRRCGLSLRDAVVVVGCRTSNTRSGRKSKKKNVILYFTRILSAGRVNVRKRSTTAPPPGRPRT